MRLYQVRIRLLPAGGSAVVVYDAKNRTELRQLVKQKHGLGEDDVLDIKDVGEAATHVADEPRFAGTEMAAIASVGLAGLGLLLWFVDIVVDL